EVEEVAAAMRAALCGEDTPSPEHLRAWTEQDASLDAAGDRAVTALAPLFLPPPHPAHGGPRRHRPLLGRAVDLDHHRRLGPADDSPQLRARRLQPRELAADGVRAPG